MGGVAWIFTSLCSCHVFTGDGCLWHGCLQNFMSGTYITIKKNRIITCWHILPQFWKQPFLRWFLLGEKVLKSQGLGEGGQRAQTSIIKWVSYGDVMCGLVIIVNPTVLNIESWPPHVKSWLIGKDSDAGRDWGQEEKGTTEDEMARWHHWLNGHEFEWTLGDDDGQGGLACCDSWGCKESDTTEWTELNWRELNISYNNKKNCDCVCYPKPQDQGARMLPVCHCFQGLSEYRVRDCVYVCEWVCKHISNYCRLPLYI